MKSCLHEKETLTIDEMESSEPICSSIIFSDQTIREEGSGKLSLIGCFQGFNASHFPFQSPSFFITVFITNLRAVPELLHVTANIKIPKAGVVLASCGAQLRPPQHGATINPKVCIEIPLPFASVTFGAAGEYDVTVLVDEEEVGSRPIFVNTVPNPAQ